MSGVTKDQEQEIRRIYEKQKANRRLYANSTAKQRIAKLRRIRDLLYERRTELHEALYDDFRKNAGEADLTEVYPVMSEINHAIKHLPQWMKPVKAKTPLVMFGTTGQLRYDPKGFVLILSPWNYPVNLCLNPLVAALSAGNSAIIKPSSKVPNTASFLKRLISDAFDEAEVAVIEGSSAVSNALLERKFDHIFFTGSPRIGKHVMAAAAKHLTPVTLELGGKSPVIVDRSADVTRAAERIVWGKFINAGQTCIAPDYLLIHESQLDKFVSVAKATLQNRYGEQEEERRNNKSFCRLVSEGHQQNLEKILDASLEKGATVAFGGNSDSRDRYLEPTLLTGVTEDSPIMEEEIFGPILPIVTFTDLDDPIRIINSKHKPLALYIFSENQSNIDRILEYTDSGGVCINSVIIHLANPDLPFGGVGQSGIGNYHGFYGFRNLSHERTVVRQGKPDVIKYFYPPYTKPVKKLIKSAVKYLS